MPAGSILQPANSGHDDCEQPPDIVVTALNEEGDVAYTDSTVYLALTSEGEDILMETDSAFYDGSLVQSLEERRAIVKAEQERMRSMCFTFRADPFSHRRTASADDNGDGSSYYAQAHTSPPLLYCFSVEAASPLKDDTSSEETSGSSSPPDTSAFQTSGLNSHPDALRQTSSCDIEEPSRQTYESTTQFSSLLTFSSSPSTPSPPPVYYPSSSFSSSSSSSSLSLPSLNQSYAQGVKRENLDGSALEFSQWGMISTTPSMRMQYQYDYSVPNLTKAEYFGEHPSY